MANSIFLWPGGIQTTGNGSVVVPTGGQFLGPDGSITVPTYSFTNDPDTGFYTPTSGQVRFTGNGLDGPTFASNGINLPAGGILRSNANGTKIDFPSDGTITLLDNAGTSFARLMFGGTTSSFPALKRSTTELHVRLADDSAFASIQAAVVQGNSGFVSGAANSINWSGRSRMTSPADSDILFTDSGSTTFGKLQFRTTSGPFISATLPSISSGFGTSPSVTAGGAGFAFRVNVGTGGTASGGVIAMNQTAPNGWNAYVENITGTAANRANVRTVVTAGSTTTVTVQNQTISTGAAVAWTASDILLVIAFAW